MKRNMYGYIRVSSKDQHVDRQKIALTEYGIPERDLFTFDVPHDSSAPQAQFVCRPHLFSH